jgi:hypothetical protein
MSFMLVFGFFIGTRYKSTDYYPLTWTTCAIRWWKLVNLSANRIHELLLA